MRAKSAYNALEKGKNLFQLFQVEWQECLTELQESGIFKGGRDLFLDYLVKCGNVLKTKVLEDTRFWPLKPREGETPTFRKCQTWQEAAVVAKEACSLIEASRALSDHSLATGDGSWE